jgi:hypothetical protein
MVRSFLPLLLADIDLRCRLRTLAHDGHIQSCVPYQVRFSLPVAAQSTSQYDSSSAGQKVLSRLLRDQENRHQHIVGGLWVDILDASKQVAPVSGRVNAQALASMLAHLSIALAAFVLNSDMNPMCFISAGLLAMEVIFNRPELIDRKLYTLRLGHMQEGTLLLLYCWTVPNAMSPSGEVADTLRG